MRLTKKQKEILQVAKEERDCYFDSKNSDVNLLLEKGLIKVEHYPDMYHNQTMVKPVLLTSKTMQARNQKYSNRRAKPADSIEK